MNNVCGDCGAGNESGVNFCVSCGTRMKVSDAAAVDAAQMPGVENAGLEPDSAVAPSEQKSARIAANALDGGKRLAADARARVAAAPPYKVKAVITLGVTLLAWALLELARAPNAPPSGWNYLAWTVFLLTLVPMSFGALMILISGAATPEWFLKSSAWMDRRAANSRVSERRFNRFVARPALWSYATLDERASRIEDGMLRNGAKVASFAFCVILFGLLLFWIAAIAITLVLLVLFGALTMFIVDGVYGTRTDTSRISNALKSGLGSSPGKIYSGTSLNEQVAGRIDDSGNVLQGSNFFNEQKVGRVDAKGNLHKGTNVLNEQKVGRTDEEGNVFEGTNFFNEQKTGRVDEDGNVYEGSNVFNERKVGRVKKE